MYFYLLMIGIPIGCGSLMDVHLDSRAADPNSIPGLHLWVFKSNADIILLSLNQQPQKGLTSGKRLKL